MSLGVGGPAQPPGNRVGGWERPEPPPPPCSWFQGGESHGQHLACVYRSLLGFSKMLLSPPPCKEGRGTPDRQTEGC